MESFKSALVTGASGFIGKTLVEHLIKNNVETYCIIRNQSSQLPSGANQLIVPEFSYENIVNAVRNIKVDVIFHLAAYGVRPEDRDPLITANVNIIAPIALLEAAKNWNLQQFIHIGSCAEYGVPLLNTPITETHELNPVSVYGASKATAQMYLSAIASSFKLPFIHLRLFGVYGQGEAEYRLVPYVIKCLLENRKALLSAGLQLRDFLYIDDAINAIISATKITVPYEICNICSGEGLPVNVAAKTIAKLLQKPETLLDFNAIPMRPDETMWLVGNNQKFRKLTGWQPKFTLEQGLRKMINCIVS